MRGTFPSFSPPLSWIILCQKFEAAVPAAAPAASVEKTPSSGTIVRGIEQKN